jgi:O-antigen/teichoic acid export membrane protein
MSVVRSVALNTFLQFLARFTGLVSATVVTILLLRYLGVDGRGRYDTIFAFTTLFGTISEFGFFTVFMKEFSQHPEKRAEILANAIPLRTIVSLLVVGIGVAIAYLTDYESVVKIGILLLAGMTLFTTLTNTFVSVFQAELKMAVPVIAEIVGRLFYLFAVIAAVTFHWSLITIVALAVLGFFWTFLINLFAVRRWVPLGLKFDFPYWRKILRAAIPLGIVTVIALLYFKVDLIMLSLMRSPTDVGIYGPTYKILEILLAFPAIFMGLVFPVVARVLVTDRAKANHYFQRALEFLGILALPLAVGAIIFAPQIVELLDFGKGQLLFASTVSFGGVALTAVTVLRIIAVAIVIDFFAQGFATLLPIFDLQRRYLPYALAVLGLNIGANLVLIPRYSYVGAAATTVLTELVALAFTATMVLRASRFKISLTPLGKALLSAIAMGAVLFPFREAGWQWLPAVILGGGLVYGIVLYVLGGIPKETLSELFRFKKALPVDSTSTGR